MHGALGPLPPASAFKKIKDLQKATKEALKEQINHDRQALGLKPTQKVHIWLMA